MTAEEKIKSAKELKEQYINKAERKLLVTYKESYYDVSEFRPGKYPDGITHISFKKPSSTYIALLVFFAMGLMMGIVPVITKGHKMAGYETNLFYGAIGLVITGIMFLRRKNKLVVDDVGIFYYKWDEYIRWHEIVLVMVKTTEDNSADPYYQKELLIHYFSDNYKQLLFESLDIGKLETKYKYVGNAVSFFWKKSLQH